MHLLLQRLELFCKLRNGVLLLVVAGRRLCSRSLSESLCSCHLLLRRRDLGLIRGSRIQCLGGSNLHVEVLHRLVLLLGALDSAQAVRLQKTLQFLVDNMLQLLELLAGLGDEPRCPSALLRRLPWFLQPKA